MFLLCFVDINIFLYFVPSMFIAFLVGLVLMKMNLQLILGMELCSEMCFELEVGLDVAPYPWFLLSVDMKTLTEPDTVIRYLVNC